MAKKDYYAILGVPNTADEKKMKKAFRKLAKKYHPDTNQGNAQAEQRFKDINEAYAVLGDPKKRALYDKYGEMGLQEGFDPKAYEQWQQAGRGYGGFTSDGGFGGFGGFSSDGGFNGFSSSHGFNSNGTGGWREVHFSGDPNSMGDMGDLGDLFSRMFGGSAHAGRSSAHARGGSAYTGGTAGGAGYESGYGRGAGFESGYGRGTDASAQINISFEEAALGCDKTISLSSPDKTLSSLQVHIPAGIGEGQKIRLKGQGMAGGGNGAKGDLFLQVHILPKKNFERKGQDIYVTVQIPFVTAALGGEAIVPTLTGKVSCRIPAGTQSGSKIRLKGKGIVSMKDPKQIGDEYVVIGIQVPKNLSAQQKEKLQEFAGLAYTGTGQQSASHASSSERTAHGSASATHSNESSARSTGASGSNSSNRTSGHVNAA